MTVPTALQTQRFELGVDVNLGSFLNALAIAVGAKRPFEQRDEI